MQRATPTGPSFECKLNVATKIGDMRKIALPFNVSGELLYENGR
jgi:hypothetical protein